MSDSEVRFRDHDAEDNVFDIADWEMEIQDEVGG
jgi:hypothetical protein